MTPKKMKAEMVALAGDWAELGLIESVTQFKKDLVVDIDPNDPNRLNMILPPDLVNQLRVMASRIDFRL
jgi:phage tail sheath gpL-like